MTNIADVIGWKFNNQTGMRCQEIDGVIKVVEFPGGIPPQADQDLWTSEYEAFVAAGGLKEREASDGLQIDTFKRLIFEVMFNQENRIRVLEGKLPVNRSTYRDNLIALYKTL
jgi:hypothetical protein